ncbi:hypothetical protein [Arthrobacter sp. EpRS71]|nr:hypothetical protein [Arthrobacter sp. EpRS71]
MAKNASHVALLDLSFIQAPIRFVEIRPAQGNMGTRALPPTATL